MLLALLYSVFRLVLDALIDRLVLDALIDRRRSDASLRLELFVLRHQLRVLERQVKRPRWRSAGIFGPTHLEKVLAEFIDHYNQARPHQGLDQRVPCAPADTIVTLGGLVERRDRLGDLLHEYVRAA